eukprot:TRINITY_DN2949_c0_g1_i1.p1 TRINITY_DN2949_c0_g1~~TRINITY_DN2949_c0_g1_i1.p1  ORF type:complete len:459 (+),score=164.43 TRINITY_DN2949_c0_g1_i1:36-1379(+)
MGLPMPSCAYFCLSTLLLFVGMVCLMCKSKKRRRNSDGTLVVGFIHPDLGIGGAERLVVDAAVGLLSAGHHVVMYTSHHDPSHCFVETKDGTVEVVVAGDWMPRHIKGKGHVLFATLRSIWLTFYCILAAPPVDAYIVDQVSVPLLLLRCLSCMPTLFYCHFPDKLCDATLNTERSALRKAYRLVFDTIEEVCLRCATVIVFNSRFTKLTTLTTFPSITASISANDVLYPPMNWSKLDTRPPGSSSRLDGLTGKHVILSINRFESKKNVRLALDAFDEALEQLEPAMRDDCRLVLAGGYDERLVDNVKCLKELKEAAERSRWGKQVVFITSFSEYEKYVLLHEARLLLYTPTGEHFGIVPLEAMYCGMPVVAVNSAGPLETVVHGETGFLEEPTKAAFSKALLTLLNDPALTGHMRATAPDHVKGKFSLHAFTTSLTQHLNSIVGAS